MQIFVKTLQSETTEPEQAIDTIDNDKAKTQDKEGYNDHQKDVTVAMEELLVWMRTEAYYQTHGGNHPDWLEGGKMAKDYLKMVDSAGIQRKDCLIVEYNRILNTNLGRRTLEGKHDKAKIQDKEGSSVRASALRLACGLPITD